MLHIKYISVYFFTRMLSFEMGEAFVVLKIQVVWTSIGKLIPTLDDSYDQYFTWVFSPVVNFAGSVLCNWPND